METKRWLFICMYRQILDGQLLVSFESKLKSRSFINVYIRDLLLIDTVCPEKMEPLSVAQKRHHLFLFFIQFLWGFIIDIKIITVLLLFTIVIRKKLIFIYSMFFPLR